MTSNELDTIVNDDFKLVSRLTSGEIHAEGISQMIMGMPMTKILLHTVLEPKTRGKAEVRRAVGWLTMPTGVLIEMASLILQRAKANEALLQNMNSDQGLRLKAMLEGVQPQEDDDPGIDVE